MLTHTGTNLRKNQKIRQNPLWFKLTKDLNPSVKNSIVIFTHPIGSIIIYFVNKLKKTYTSS
jgi:hypothetical protein